MIRIHRGKPVKFSIFFLRPSAATTTQVAQCRVSTIHDPRDEFLDSIAENDRIIKVARTILQLRGNHWRTLKAKFLRTFCNRETLISTYKRRLANLRSTSASCIRERYAGQISLPPSGEYPPVGVSFDRFHPERPEQKAIQFANPIHGRSIDAYPLSHAFHGPRENSLRCTAVRSYKFCIQMYSFYRTVQRMGIIILRVRDIYVCIR